MKLIFTSETFHILDTVAAIVDGSVVTVAGVADIRRVVAADGIGVLGPDINLWLLILRTVHLTYCPDCLVHSR